MTLRIVKSIVKESQFEAILAELNFNYESESDVAMQNFLDFSAWKHAARNWKNVSKLKTSNLSSLKNSDTL